MHCTDWTPTFAAADLTLKSQQLCQLAYGCRCLRMQQAGACWPPGLMVSPALPLTALLRSERSLLPLRPLLNLTARPDSDRVHSLRIWKDISPLPAHGRLQPTASAMAQAQRTRSALTGQLAQVHSASRIFVAAAVRTSATTATLHLNARYAPHV